MLRRLKPNQSSVPSPQPELFLPPGWRSPNPLREHHLEERAEMCVGTVIHFHPHNRQQVCARRHLQRESWQARSQLWLALENNNNIHLGVWNYLSLLVEVLPKAKGKKKEGNIQWIISSVHSPSWEPINSVTKNKQYSCCYHDCSAFKRHWQVGKSEKSQQLTGYGWVNFTREFYAVFPSPQRFSFFLFSFCPWCPIFFLWLCWGWQ